MYLKISSLWIPYIIFKNTDDDEAVKIDAQTEDGNIRTKVSIKREQGFSRSGPEVADEVNKVFENEYFKIYNMLPKMPTLC